MASTSAVSLALPLSQKRATMPSSDAFFKPLPLKKTITPPTRSNRAFQVNASLKEKAVTGLTAAALTASMFAPDVAQAAEGVSPSLKNFLLSIVAGGVVLVAIVGVVIGVANFDPVKRT